MGKFTKNCCFLIGEILYFPVCILFLNTLTFYRHFTANIHRNQVLFSSNVPGTRSRDILKNFNFHISYTSISTWDIPESNRFYNYCLENLVLQVYDVLKSPIERDFAQIIIPNFYDPCSFEIWYGVPNGYMSETI